MHAIIFRHLLPWVLTSVCLCVVSGGPSGPPDPVKQAREAALELATDTISVGKDVIGSGNAADATTLATEVSETLQAAQAAMFSGASANHKGDEFLSYGRMSPEVLVFLIHVPNLGDYKSEAKDVIRALCWNVAVLKTIDSSVAPKAGTPPGRRDPGELHV